MTNGRPAPEETSEYYHQYIARVPGGDIRQILESQREDALAVLQRIPADKATFAYAPNKWTVNDLLGHLCDAERLYTFRAMWFARSNPHALPSWESDDAVVIANASSRTLASLVEEFAAIRSATITFFNNLPDEAWTRGGVASGVPFTVRALAYIAAGHVIHHLDILEKRYL